MKKGKTLCKFETTKELRSTSPHLKMHKVNDTRNNNNKLK